MREWKVKKKTEKEIRLNTKKCLSFDTYHTTLVFHVSDMSEFEEILARHLDAEEDSDADKRGVEDGMYHN